MSTLAWSLLGGLTALVVCSIVSNIIALRVKYPPGQFGAQVEAEPDSDVNVSLTRQIVDLQQANEILRETLYDVRGVLRHLATNTNDGDARLVADSMANVISDRMLDAMTLAKPQRDTTG